MGYEVSYLLALRRLHLALQFDPPRRWLAHVLLEAAGHLLGVGREVKLGGNHGDQLLEVCGQREGVRGGGGLGIWRGWG